MRSLREGSSSATRNFEREVKIAQKLPNMTKHFEKLSNFGREKSESAPKFGRSQLSKVAHNGKENDSTLVPLEIVDARKKSCYVKCQANGFLLAVASNGTEKNLLARNVLLFQILL